MDKKICLDADVCIELIKGNSSIESIFDKFDECDVFITSITVFELFLRETNLKEIEEFVGHFNMLYFDNLCVIKGSDLFKDLKKKGDIIDFRDLFVAATCIVNDCFLLTLNRKHFDRIKELKLLDIFER